jgi:hypothetical protein
MEDMMATVRNLKEEARIDTVVPPVDPEKEGAPCATSTGPSTGEAKNADATYAGKASLATSDEARCSDEVEGIGGLVTAAFALGQIVGPLLGTTLTETIGFEAASIVMAAVLCMLVPLVACMSGARMSRVRRARRARKHMKLREEGGEDIELDAEVEV